MLTRSLSPSRCGTLLGLALLFAFPTHADDALRKQVHRDYGHRSYMLFEDAAGARLFLFADEMKPSQTTEIAIETDAKEIALALEAARHDDPRTRVRALTRLAGVDSAESLDLAVTLLSDPSPAVREEARSLILDHPDGKAMVDALGLVDEDTAE